MKVRKRKRSVVPVYLIALTWLIATFLFGVKTVTGYGVTAAVSVLAFFVGRLLFPDQVWEEEAPQPAPEPEDPEVAALQKERERAVSELRRLNENIADEEISARLSHMEAATDRIFDHVLAHPEKRSVVRRFMDYYLPTTSTTGWISWAWAEKTSPLPKTRSAPCWRRSPPPLTSSLTVSSGTNTWTFLLRSPSWSR